MLVAGQIVENSQYVSQSSYTTPALPSGVTLGNLLLACVQYGSNLARTFNCAVNGVNMTEIGSGFYNGTEQWGIRMFVYPNTPTIAQASALATVSGWSNNPIACGISLHERTGLRTTGVVDGSALFTRVASPGATTDAINLGSMSPSEVEAELVSFIANVTGSGGPPNAGTNYTSIGVGWDYAEGSGTNSLRVSERLLTSLGSVNVTGTALGADASAVFYGSSVLLLRPAAPAAGYPAGRRSPARPTEMGRQFPGLVI